MAENKDVPSAFGYIRTASVFDLKAIWEQATQIRDHCNTQGIKLEALFVDQGKDADNFKGPAWADMEGFLKGSFKGKINSVIVSDTNRLTTDVGLLLLKQHELRTGLGVTIDVAGGRQMEQDKGFFLN